MRLNKQSLVLGIILPLIFLSLILFNQKKAQKAILSSQTPLYNTSFLNSPSNAQANESVEFIWDVEAPDTAMTTMTTIYYGFTSSPSALTNQNSPQAVGYPYKLSDYSIGTFSLPDTFSASTSFLSGTVFYRSYAKVGNQHLWSEEVKLSIR
jgi:hypothetical protein